MTLRVVAAELRRLPGGVHLVLVDDTGARGQGEASPLAGYSPDTRDACAGWLETAPWSELGPIALDRPLAAGLAAALDRAGARLPAARFAVETALVDLVGQRLGRSAARVLARERAPRAVALAALLPRDEGLVAAAEAARARGLETVKVKLRGATDDELAAVAELRRRLGPKLRLRLDANRSLAPDTAVDRLRALAAFAPELVEEPVPIAALERLLERPPPVPIALDESLQEAAVEARLDAWLAAGTVGALVLKPTALGGALRCLDLAARARGHGAGAIVTHTCDGPIALAAAAALACALPEPLPCGLDRHLGLDAWPPLELPMLERASVVPVAVPGLGVAELPPAAAGELARSERRHPTW